MKNIFLLLTTTLILVGCATPLTIETDGDRYAKLLDIRPSDIEFISLSDFGITDLSTSNAFGIVGAFVLTKEAVYLVKEGSEKGAEIPIAKLNNEDIRGVALKSFGLNRQFHFLLDDMSIMLTLTRNRQQVDRKSSDRVYSMLIERGVPELKDAKFVQPKQGTPIIVPIPL